MANDLSAFDFARDGQNLLGVELHHATFVVLAQNGKEIQKPANVFFSVLRGAALLGCLGAQVVGKLIVNDQRPRWIKVEEIGPLFAVNLAVGVCVRIGISKSVLFFLNK